jgi:hypothetical protein
MARTDPAAELPIAAAPEEGMRLGPWRTGGASQMPTGVVRLVVIWPTVSLTPLGPVQGLPLVVLAEPGATAVNGQQVPVARRQRTTPGRLRWQPQAWYAHTRVNGQDGLRMSPSSRPFNPPLKPTCGEDLSLSGHATSACQLKLLSRAPFARGLRAPLSGLAGWAVPRPWAARRWKRFGPANLQRRRSAMPMGIT